MRSRLLDVVRIVVAVLVLGGGEVSLSTESSWGAIPLIGASLFGGPFARWLAGFQPPRPDAVS